MNKTLGSSSLFTGTIIGAGILGLPYIIEQTGFIIGLMEIIFIGFIILLISLMTGEIVLRTKQSHQIPGLVEKYIGKKTKHIITFLSLVFMYGAMIAYIQGCGNIIILLGFTPLIAKLLCFILLTTIIHFGIKGVEDGELILTPLIIICILIISVSTLFYFEPSNLAKVDISNTLSPIGVIMFAFAGLFAIPQMKEILGSEKKKLRKSILIGYFIPFLIYIFFVFSCIGALGENISEIATISLGNQYGIFFLIFGNLFAFFAMATCFISIGNSAKEIYNQDYKINNNLSTILALFPSLIALGNFSTFTQILSLTGSIVFTPILIIVIYVFYKAKKKGERKPEYELKIPNWSLWLIVLFLLFTAGLIGWQFLLF